MIETHSTALSSKATSRQTHESWKVKAQMTHVDMDGNILGLFSLQRIVNQLEVLVVLCVCSSEGTQSPLPMTEWTLETNHGWHI